MKNLSNISLSFSWYQNQPTLCANKHNDIIVGGRPDIETGHFKDIELS